MNGHRCRSHCESGDSRQPLSVRDGCHMDRLSAGTSADDWRGVEGKSDGSNPPLPQPAAVPDVTAAVRTRACRPALFDMRPSKPERHMYTC